MSIRSRFTRILTLALVTMSTLVLASGTAGAASLTWDSNAVGVDVTDGAGAWLGTGQWWDGATNIDWTAGDDAIFGVGGSIGNGANVTLASPTTVGALTINPFTSNGTTRWYTLGSSGQAITLNGGITMDAASGPVNIVSPIILGADQIWANNTAAAVDKNPPGTLQAAAGISGAFGITKNGDGYLNMRGTNTFTGDLIVNGGAVLVHNYSLGSGNLALNNGVLESYWGGTMNRNLGAGPGEIQVHGVSGFSGQGSNGTTVKLNNGAVQWGSTFFDPTTLVLQNPTSNTNGKVNFSSPLDLNGAQRTVSVNKDHADTYGQLSGVLSNTDAVNPGGLTKTGPGMLILTSNSNSYDGPTIVNEGVLALGTGWQSAQSIPGGITNKAGEPLKGLSNLEINGGNVRLAYYLNRPLGDGPTDIQITGGVSGFSHIQADTYGRITLNLDANYEIVWGTDYFKPDVFVLNESDAKPDQVVNIQNKIDLNGADRTVATNSTRAVSGNYIKDANGWMTTTGGRLTGDIQNSGLTPAGLIKVGPGTLQLTATNTYDGGTTINEGTLQFTQAAAMPGFGVVTVKADTTLAVTVDGWSDGPSDYGTIAGLLNGLGGTTGGTVTFEAGSALELVTTGTSTLASPLSGAFPLTHAGPGTLVLAGDNTHTGGTVAKGGTLQLSHAGALGGTTGELIVTGGDVTLDTTVNINTLTFDTGSSQSVTGGTLAFAPGGSISNSDNRVDQTITSAITGGPDVFIKDYGAGNQYKGIIFAPDSGTQALGDVLNPNNTGNTDKSGITLGGSTTGNSVASISYAGGDRYGTVYVQGGQWTVGDITTGTIRHSDGTLVLNGTAAAGYQGYVFTGGTLAGNGTVDNDLSMPAGAVIAPGSSIGTLSFNNSLTWASDDATAGMVFDLSTTDNTGDLLEITGDLTKGAGSSFIFDFVGATGSQTYTLANFASTDFVPGDFSYLPEGLDGTFVVNPTSLQYVTVDAVQRWDGTVDEDWADAHWSYGGIGVVGTPVADEHMTISSGKAIVSTDMTATPAASLKIARFTDGGTVQIDAAASLTVTGPIQVRNGGALNVNGTLTASTLRVDTGATLSVAGTADFKVSDQAVIGDTIVATIDAPANAFNVSGADVLTARTLTLNGGTLDLVAPVVGGEVLPPTMPASLEAHFDAGTLSYADGETVDTWADISGNEHVATKSGGTITYASDFVNGKPVVRFTANNTWANISGNMYSKQQYAVVKINGGDWGALMGSQSQSDYMIRQNGTFWSNNMPLAVSKDGVVLASPFNHGDNGPFMILEITGNDNNVNDRLYALGKQQGWDDINMDLAEILAFNAELGAADKNNLGAYLAAKYDISAPDYTGALQYAPITRMLPNTTIATTADSTVALAASESLVLGGVAAGAGSSLTIDSSAAKIALTNLTLGGASMVRSTAAAVNTDVTVTASSLTLGGGMNYLGDRAILIPGAGDDMKTHLTLSDGAVIDWTFGGAGGNTSYLDVKGNITLDGTLTVNVLDGIGTAASKDIFIMMARGTITGNAGDVTIDKPAGWEWDSFAIEQRSPSTWALVLKNVTFGTVAQDPGDTDGNGIVDDVDMANFELAFGLSGAELIAKGFAFDPDFDDDGDADLDDFVTLRQFFGTNFNDAPMIPDLSQTPEPATMSLLALGALAILRRRNRKA
jgi:autotransporter-associated beta strand protein